MMRLPKTSGQFYPPEKEEIEFFINSCKTKLNVTKNHLLAGIVPHAGYPFSGKTANTVFQKLFETQDVDTFVILGPNHSGLDTDGVSDQDWQMPNGIVKADHEIIQMIKGNIPVDNASHENEHSIEVQLPFIKYYFPYAKIVPITINNLDNLKKYTETLSPLCKEKNIFFLASSDFTHYGRSFGYMPFVENVKENVRKIDYQAIEYIKGKNPEGFLDFINQNKATICGALPIILLLNILKSVHYDVELLSYSTSADITGDTSHMVSYAGIIFQEK